MQKFLVLLSIVCLATCYMKVDLHAKSSNQRILFEPSTASTYAYSDNYDDLENQPYFEVGLGDSADLYDVQLLASTQDRVSWIPFKGCADNNGKCWGQKSLNQIYDCSSTECTQQADQGCTTYKADQTTCADNTFTSMPLSQYGQVKCNKFYYALDHFQIRNANVTDVQIRLCSQFDAKSRNGLIQHGVLGLGFSDKTRTTVAQGSQQNNLLTRMVELNLIQREEFSYYISGTESFITFGIRDDFLSRLGFAKYTFTPDWTSANSYDQSWNLVVQKLSSSNPDVNDLLTDTNFQILSNNAGQSKLSKAVFDSTAWGYYFSSAAYYNNFIKLINKNNNQQCAQFPEEAKLDPTDTTESGYTGNKYPHIRCTACSDLSNFPTLSFTFQGQLDKDDPTQPDQVWNVLPEHYAEVDDSDPNNPVCVVYVYRKITQNQVKKDANGNVALPADNDDNSKVLYLGRMWLKNFYTSFDQENSFIRISNAWQQPETFVLSQTIMIIVIVIGVIAIIFASLIQHILLFGLPSWKANQQFRPQQFTPSQPPIYQQQPVFVSQQQLPFPQQVYLSGSQVQFQQPQQQQQQQH